MKFLIMIIAVFVLMGGATIENTYPIHKPFPACVEKVCTLPNTVRTNLMWMAGQVASGFYGSHRYNIIAGENNSMGAVDTVHTDWLSDRDKDAPKRIVDTAQAIIDEVKKASKK